MSYQKQNKQTKKYHTFLISRAFGYGYYLYFTNENRGLQRWDNFSKDTMLVIESQDLSPVLIWNLSG